jgi:subtilisin-like proprotein convertase family protein
MVGLAEAKKKKKKTSTTVNLTKAVNQVVPPEATGTVDKSGVLTSQIVVGKKFKGRQISDVNATIQFSVSGTGSDLDDLFIALTAPNGATSELFSNSASGTTLGPLILDDEAFPTQFVCSSNTNPADDQESYCLYPPYIGRVQPYYIPLAVMDGGPAKGTWTLTAYNAEDDPLEVHTFGSWGIEVKTHSPYVQK